MQSPRPKAPLERDEDDGAIQMTDFSAPGRVHTDVVTSDVYLAHDHMPWWRHLCTRRFRMGAAVGAVLIAVCVVMIVVFTASMKGLPAGGSTNNPPCILGEGIRLPGTVVPLTYSIVWRPQFVSPYTFTGSVLITAQATHDTTCIVLNSEALSFTGDVMVSVQTLPAKAAAYTFNTTLSQVVIKPVDIMYAGNTVTISIPFKGNLGPNLSGLYLSTYQDASGATVPMVVTQFEATAARRAFPSFDEPAYKAKFTVAVGNVPAKFMALGNMPKASNVSDPLSPGARLITFQQTVKMSTYLVALVVGDLKYTEGWTNAYGSTAPVKVRVWARSGFETQTTFAKDTAVSVLNYYQNMFGIGFPLPKVDCVAIPDFAAGAMENWGLVTYRETALLADPSTASQSELQRVAVVIAHELAHQWFGNLVTMQWWNELWLNEGFASYTEFLGTDAARPQFQIWKQFLSSDVQPAAQVDSYQASHALSGAAVNTNQAIESMFDSITYSKGASLIRMVKAFMERSTPGSFNAGIHDYLLTHSYGNAQASDLFSSLGQQLPSSLPALATLVQPYYLEPGMPLVTFSWETPAAAAAGKGNLVVTQSRFYVNPAAPASDTTWWVPIDLRAQRPAAATGVSQANQVSLATSGFAVSQWSEMVNVDLSRDGWIKANQNQTGYYRVNYPVNVWQALAADLSNQLQTGNIQLGDDDRAGLLDDAMYLTLAGKLASAPALNMTKFLKYERSFTVWTTAISHLQSIYNMLVPDIGAPSTAQQSCINKFQTYAASRIVPTLTSVGWLPKPTDNVLTVFVRSRVIDAASFFGDTPTINEARTRYNAWVANQTTTQITADIQQAIFSSVVRWGGEAEFNAIWQVFLNSPSQTIQRRAMLALAESRNATLLNRLLSESLGTHIRSQDTPTVLARVAANPYGKVLAWNFLVANWNTINARYGGGGFAMSTIVETLTGRFSSTTMQNQVKAFWSNTPVPAAALEVIRGEDMIASRVNWVQNESAGACAWLQQQ